MAQSPASKTSVSADVPVEKDLAANQEVANEPKTDDVKCDNHPQRKARTFTGSGAYELNLCDECTPEWFKDPE